MGRIGVRFLDNVGSTREIVDYAVRAEELGFDSVWFPHDAYRVNSWVLLSAVAARTNTIKLGSRQNVYTIHPSEIATFISTLDQISDGRAVLAPGLHNTDALDWSGIPHENPVQRTREVVEIVRRLLRGEKVPYQGQEFSLTDRAFLRVPPTGENIPILVVPVGNELLELSGEIGDGSVPMITPPASAGLMVDAIHRGAVRAGRDPKSLDIVGYVWICVAEDGQLARDTLADIVGTFGAYLEEEALACIGLSKSDFIPILKLLNQGEREAARELVTPDMLKLAICGTPNECIEQIGEILDTGVTNVSLGGPLGPRVDQAMNLIGDKILPVFRD